MKEVFETIGFVVAVIIADIFISGIAVIMFRTEGDDDILIPICVVNVLAVVGLAFALYITQGGMK